MRQFILATNTNYGSGASAAAIQNGAVAFAYNDNGKFTVDDDGSGIKKEGMLVLGRTGEAGPVILPIFKNNFTYVKGEYQAATTFAGNITIPAINQIGDYSVVIAKKGLKFNERNKWTATVHIVDTTTTPAQLATKLVAEINRNTSGHGCTATASDGVVTILATHKAEDYSILGADLLFGATVEVTTKGLPAYGDAGYVADLADKAAADAGIEYTYQDYNTYMYPTYPLNPLKRDDSTDTGFTIFTLRFAEPSDVKTRDEVVNQIIQVAFPTNAAAITTFETVCQALSEA